MITNQPQLISHTNNMRRICLWWNKNWRDTTAWIEVIFISISSETHTTLWDTFFNKMDKATREKKELLINHLVTERNKIEDACGGKSHDDIKKVYNMIPILLLNSRWRFHLDYRLWSELEWTWHREICKWKICYTEISRVAYRAYLEDRKIIQRLRDKLKDPDYISDLENDPELQDWQKSIPDL